MSSPKPYSNIEDIKDTIGTAKMRTNAIGSEKAQYKMLLQAENLYLRSAIEHKRAKIEELIDKAREERKGIDQSKEETVVQFSIKETENGIKYVDADIDQEQFDGLSDKEKLVLATRIIKNKYQGKVIGENVKVFINSQSANEYGYPAKIIKGEVANAKSRIATELEHIIDTAYEWKNEPDGKYGHFHTNAVGGFDIAVVIFKVGNNFYQGKINTIITTKGRLLKDITQIKNITGGIMNSYEINSKFQADNDVSTNNISKSRENVNTNTENFTKDETQYSLKGKGYIGQSMSVNAYESYQNGEMPMSKWTKTAIMEVLSNNDISQEKLDILSKFTLSQLKKEFLSYTGWHHTGKFYNETDFYGLDIERIEDMSVEELQRELEYVQGKRNRAEDIRAENEKKKQEQIALVNQIKEKGERVFVVDKIDDQLGYEVEIGYKYNGKVVSKDNILDEQFYDRWVYNNEEQAYSFAQDRTEMLARGHIDLSNANMTTRASKWLKSIVDNAYTKEKNYVQFDMPIEKSKSKAVYLKGRKPTQSDYVSGLENYFHKGEERLQYNYDLELPAYELQVWNGKEWVGEQENFGNIEFENKIQYSKKPTATNIEETAEYEDTIFFVEELKQAITNGGRTSWSTSSILGEALRNTPSIDIISRLNNGEERIGQAFAHYLTNKKNIQELEDLLYFGATAHSQEWKSEHEKGLKRYAQLINQSLTEIAYTQTTINIEQGECTLKEIRTIFNVFNTNEDIKKLASKVFANAELSKLNISFGDSIDGYGYNNGREVVLDISYFNDAGYTNQHKAETILHELIHATTNCALSVYETNPSLLANEMRQACKTLNDIYNQIKDMKEFQNEYGKTSVYEMVAELSNERFRGKLQKVNLWTRIVDAIKKFFGIRTTTALEGASTALDYILDNTRLSRVELYYRLGDDEKALQYSRKITKEMTESESDNIPIIDLTSDKLLEEKLRGFTGAKKYSIIKQYLIENFSNVVFTLSDNKKAIMDNSDAKKLAQLADKARSVQLSNLRDVVEKAKFLNEVDVEHKKFSKMSYYLNKVMFNGEIFEIIINVGLTKNDKTYHIYDITKYNKEVVAKVNTNASGPEGNRIQNDFFTNNISNSKDKVNTLGEKFTKDNLEYSKKPSERADYVKARGKLETDKVYTKAEAEAIEKKVMELIGDEYTYAEIKHENDLIDELWRGLNRAKENEYTGIACKIADTILANAIVQDMRTDAVESARETIDALRPYLQGIKFRDTDKQEIKYKYDKQAIKIYGRWGAKNGQGISLDQLVQDQNLQYLLGDTYTTQDILEKLEETYQNAKDTIDNQVGKEIKDTLDSEELHSLRAAMVRTILKEKDKVGTKTLWKKLTGDLQTQIDTHFNINRTMYNIDRIKAMKKNGMAMELSRIFSSVNKLVYQGNIRVSAIHKVMVELNKWYSMDNPQLADLGYGEVVLVEELKEKISYLAEITADTKTISSQSIKMLDEVMAKIYHIANTYKKVYQNGKWANATEQAVKYEAIDRTNRTTPQAERKFFGKLLDKARSALEYVIDPMSVMRYHDGYNKKGFWTSMFSQFREGVMNKERRQMEIQLPLDKFLAEHKGYEYDKRTITYNGQEIPLQVALTLYMTMQREDALSGLLYNGFVYTDTEGNEVRVKGVATSEIVEEELTSVAKHHLAQLKSQLNETDLAYVTIIEDIFNKQCREEKRRTDIIRFGGSNVKNTYYIPIKRYGVKAMTVGDITYETFDNLDNASFNKNTVKNAHMLEIKPLQNVALKHIKEVTTYAHLQIPIDNFKKLYNMDLSAVVDGIENKNSAKRLGDLLEWKKGQQYLNDMVQRAVGVRAKRSGFDMFFEKIRGNTAVALLALNVKVLFTQLSSYMASWHILSTKSLLKAMFMPYKKIEIDKYCPLAQVRNYENTAVLSLSLKEDKLGKLQEKMMKPIGMADRFVVSRVFQACCVEVADTLGIDINSEECKIKAGEMLEKVILETQQNTMVTEKSAMMRSDNILARTFTMFSSDAMKNISRVIDSVGEKIALKERLAQAKKSNNQAEITELENLLKKNAKQLAKSAATMSAIAMYTSILAVLFSKLYNLDDDDESFGEAILTEFGASWLAGIPIIKEIYNLFTEGYAIEEFTLGTLNDSLSAVQGFGKAIGSGDNKKLANSTKKLIFSMGTLCGIPTKNMYRLFYGAANVIDDEAVYKWDSKFYNMPLAKDLARAMKKEDADRINTITAVALSDKVGDTSSELNKELARLVKVSGETTFFPKSLKQTFVYEKESYTLTKTELKSAKKQYEQANKKVEELIKSKNYAKANDTEKQAMIKFVYDYFFEDTIVNSIAEEKSKTMLFVSGIDIVSMATIVGLAKNIKADTDRNGQVIPGSKKKKIVQMLESQRLTANQKYLMLAYLGYSTDMDKVNQYVHTLGLTRSEQKELLKHCG